MVKNISSLAVQALKEEYPRVFCSLEYVYDYQLLVAVRLAAQCTDKRVNEVTRVLFSRFPSLSCLAQAQQSEVEEIVRPCGFFRNKAHDIIKMSHLLIERFDSRVPDNMTDLISLPGVGRKTANLILGDIYKKPAVVVDTHCMRITRKLGLHNSKNPYIIEKILWSLLPPEESNDFCHRLVMHGRLVCKAALPKCQFCCMRSFCQGNIMCAN